MRNAWHSKATLTRVRPVAYLILPGNEELIKKCRILGLQIDSLSKPATLQAQAYQVETYRQDPEKYEDVFRQHVTTKVSSTTKEFPAGTKIIYLNQRKANLAIEVLEPEAPNSFVSFDILHTQKGDVLPVYRYLKPGKIQ